MQIQGLLKLDDRVVEPALLHEGRAQVVVGVVVVRLQLHGVAEMRDGLAGPAHVQQCRAEIVFGPGIIGPDAQRLLILIDGGGKPTVAGQALPQVVVGPRVVRDLVHRILPDGHVVLVIRVAVPGANAQRQSDGGRQAHAQRCRSLCGNCCRRAISTSSR